MAHFEFATHGFQKTNLMAATAGIAGNERIRIRVECRYKFTITSLFIYLAMLVSLVNSATNAAKFVVCVIAQINTDANLAQI